MSYPTQQEVEKEFDEKFVNNTVKIGETLWIQHIDAIPKTHSHISEIRQNDLKALREWVESKRRTAPKNVFDAETKEERDNYFYNLALTDYQKYLSSLNQVNE